MTLQVSFDNSYARLPSRFFHKQTAVPVREPSLIEVNDRLAADLGLDVAALRSPEGVAIFAGNQVPEGAEPLAQAYAGHQFGGWNPQLGDGRALLLGEVTGTNGNRFDIQLKGSGRTPFSRMGDGRAWVGPVLREYLVSEAMHAMGIPTTRALAAVTTGEPVVRENGPMPGAVLTRVASSHIRVGTFQYFAARGDEEAVELLVAHVIDRHYPDAETALDLLDAVIAKQAKLVADWMAVGFIHGVMNTDNTQVAGETIDYGPCAFMDIYKADQVFSSIDMHGRYAYNQQPNVAVWNLAQFATSLLPLIDGDSEEAVRLATDAVHRFPKLYRDAWLVNFRAKLGLTGSDDADETLIDGLLGAMEDGGADFTNTFRALAEGDPRVHFDNPAPYAAWAPIYAARLERQGGPDRSAMHAANPAVIPRNHQIESVIQSAVAGEFEQFHALLDIVTNPYSEPPAVYARPPEPEQVVARTFCGT